MGLNRTTILSIPLFAVLIYFELAYLMGYGTGECPIFGTVVYNAHCVAFSLTAFFLGSLVLIFFLAGRLRASFLIASAYFGLTLLAGWSWAVSAKLLALLGVLLSLLGLYISPRKGEGKENSKSLLKTVSIVFYTLVFLIFLLSSLSYVLFFSWACGELYSGTLAILCSITSYVFIGLGILSPVLWRKGKSIPALLALLPAVLFLDFAVKLLQFSGLLWALVAVLFAMELWGRWWERHAENLKGS